MSRIAQKSLLGLAFGKLSLTPIELKRTGTLPEAGNLKPKFWGSGGITRPPCENRARPFAKYKQNPGRKLQKMS